MKFASLKPRRKAAARCAASSGPRLMRYPTAGILRACPCAASGHATAAPPSSVMNSRRFIRSARSLCHPTRSCRCLLGLLLVVATSPDNFCNRAVWGAEFQCTLTGFGDDGSTVRLDLGNVTVAILHFDPPVVDARTGTGKLRLLDIFAVIDHQGEIDVSVCQVSRDMPARVSCAGLAKAEHLFIKLGCLLQIVDFDGDVNDTGHSFSSLQKSNCVLRLSAAASGKAAATPLSSAMNRPKVQRWRAKYSRFKALRRASQQKDDALCPDGVICVEHRPLWPLFDHL